MLPESSLTAILNPPCWNRAHPSSTFPCPGSLSCNELQPAGKHSLQRASPERTMLQGPSEQQGLARLAMLSVHRHSALCPPRGHGGLTEHSEQPCNAAHGPGSQGPAKKCNSQRLQHPSPSEEHSLPDQNTGQAPASALIAIALNF